MSISGNQGRANPPLHSIQGKSLTWPHTETTNIWGDRFIGNPVLEKSPTNANAWETKKSEIQWLCCFLWNYLSCRKNHCPSGNIKRCKINCSQSNISQLQEIRGQWPRMQHGEAPLSTALFPLAFSRFFCCNFSASTCLRIFCKSLSLPSSSRLGAVPLSPGDAPRRKLDIKLTFFSSTQLWNLWETLRNLVQRFIDLYRNGFQHGSIHVIKIVN